MFVGSFLRLEYSWRTGYARCNELYIPRHVFIPLLCSIEIGCRVATYKARAVMCPALRRGRIVDHAALLILCGPLRRARTSTDIGDMP